MGLATEAAKTVAKSLASPAKKTLTQAEKAEAAGFFPHTLYHGTSTHKSGGELFSGFELFEGQDMSRSVSRSPVGKLGISIGEQPMIADDFAMQASPAGGEGAAIIPLKFRSDKMASIDLAGDESNDEIYGAVVDLWKQGYDSVRFMNYTTPKGSKGSFFLVKDPAQLRSPNAEFDPSKRNSKDLLAGIGGLAFGAGMFTPEKASADEPGATISIEELKELATLARQSGDEELEESTLTKIIELQGDRSISETTAQPKIAKGGSSGGRSGGARKFGAARAKTQAQLEQYQAGNLNSQDVTQQEMQAIQRARIAEIPEITGSFKNLSENLGVTQALAGMTAFDPDEFGKILTAADPNIGIVTTPEGERLAINRSTNEMMSINKAGPSLMDAIQLGGAAAMFSPSGALQGIGRQALGAAGTQALIEAGQTAAGGELNPEEVVIAGAAVPVIAGVAKYGKQAIDSFRTSVRANTNLIDDATGMPTRALESSLSKYGLDAGDLMKNADNLPAIYTANTPDKYVEDLVKKQINTGKTSNYIAKIRLDNKGDIVPDELGKKAVSQGFQAGDVAASKQANAPTRSAMRRMLNMQRSILADKSNVDRFRPSDMAGDAVMDRFNFVRSRADELRKELNRIAEKDFTIRGRNLIGDAERIKGMDIDTSGIEKALFDGFDSLNVQNIGKKDISIIDMVKDKGFFTGSQISKDKTSQRIIRDVVDLLAEPGKVDALRAHNVKKQLDALIDFNKKASTGLTEAGRNFAKAIRHELNESVRTVSPKYAAINDNLSASIRALNDLGDSVPRKIDLFAPNANQALGTDLRKLLSNYGTRQILNNSLNQIDDVARQLGGSFNVSYRELNRFANVLDKRFGSVAENSFKGNIDAALDLNQLRSTSVRDAVEKKLIGKIADKFGPNDKAAMDVMNKILIRGQ